MQPAANKSPKDGGEALPTTTDSSRTQKETDETTKEADTTVPTAEGSTDTTTDTITETTEAETETTTVEEVKPWDLLNNEPLNRQHRAMMSLTDL